MSRKTPALNSRRRAARESGGPSTQLPAAEFKATCLELMNRVRETGAEYVVTKHGRPVARLVPCVSEATASFFGSMKGTVLAYERPLDPIEGEYQIDAPGDASIHRGTASAPARRRGRSMGAASPAQRSRRSAS